MSRKGLPCICPSKLEAVIDPLAKLPDIWPVGLSALNSVTTTSPFLPLAAL
ncbi:MAG: hypothetical protein QOK90_08045 [Nitrososphaeraceae archaeon]|nr:hypothetical protein [Nitrososphaeraceae archaeon]